MYVRYLTSVKNSLNFTNRSSRKDIFCYTLVNIIIILLLELCSFVFHVEVHSTDLPNLPGDLKILYAIFITFTTLAIVVRRLHDMNRTGFYSLLLFLPVINIILYIFLLFAHSKENFKGINKYGRRLYSTPQARFSRGRLATK